MRVWNVPCKLPKRFSPTAGEFGMLYDKRMLYETDIRVPLFVRGAVHSVTIRALTPHSAHQI